LHTDTNKQGYSNEQLSVVKHDTLYLYNAISFTISVYPYQL